MDVDPGFATPQRYPVEVTQTVGAVLRDFTLAHPNFSALVPDDTALNAYDAICETLTLDDETTLLERVDALDAHPNAEYLIDVEEREHYGSLRGHYEAWLSRYSGDTDSAGRERALEDLRQTVAERLFRLAYFHEQVEGHEATQRVVGEAAHRHRFVRGSLDFLSASVLVTTVARDAWRQLHPPDRDGSALAEAA